jgi:mannose-6-phosphate isomerase-like protein (cupin superfamily)
MKISTKTLSAVVALAWVVAVPASAQGIDDRILHNDPANYRLAEAPHAGAGPLDYTAIIDRGEMATDFLYLHAGRLLPKGGIGHHFHHSKEEMYVILNGEAEFTVDGRTSLIQAPVVVPNKLGSSHAVVNTTDESLRWLNFAVAKENAKGGSFDLGDDRVGVPLDPVPVFVYSRLDQESHQREVFTQSDERVHYTRILGPDIFTTNWNHVDQIILPAGSSSDSRQLVGMEEVYYVMEGSGTVSIDGATASIEMDDAFSITMGETVSISNNGSEDLKVLVIGIAEDKDSIPAE